MAASSTLHDHVVSSRREVSASDAHNPDGSIAHLRWLYDDAGRLAESTFGLDDGPVSRTLYSYDEAGRHVRTVQLGPDGAQTDLETCTYDAGGKKTKMRFLGLAGANAAYGMEGTDHAYGAPGATMMTTTYDDRDLPTKVVFQDANHNSIRHVIFTRDNAGRLLKEEMHAGAESPFPDLLEHVPPEGRKDMAAVLEKVFGQTFTSTAYVYDARGRLIERTHAMGSLGGDRTTYLYDDDHDDPIEETTENRHRDASIGENGTLSYTSDQVHLQHNRLAYRYDPQGNWIERVVSIRPEPNPDFQPSHIERRTITYHAA